MARYTLTVFTKLFAVVWIGVIIGNFIVITFLITGIIPLNISLGIIALLLGMGSIVSGYMQKRLMIKVTSVLWYLLAIVLFLVKDSSASYIIGYSTFFLSFIPGILLRKNSVQL